MIPFNIRDCRILIEREHGEVNPRLRPGGKGASRAHDTVSDASGSGGAGRGVRAGEGPGRRRAVGEGSPRGEADAEGAADLGEVGDDAGEEGRGGRRGRGARGRGAVAAGGVGRGGEGRGVGVGRREERVEEAGDVEQVAAQLRQVVPDAAQPARHPDRAAGGGGAEGGVARRSARRGEFSAAAAAAGGIGSAFRLRRGVALLCFARWGWGRRQ